MQVSADGVHSVTHGSGFLPVSITKCLLWNVVWMWSTALVGEKRACCNIVWVVPNCRDDKEAWHRLKSLYIWLSRTTNTKQQNTTANRAGAKLNTNCGHTAARKDNKQRTILNTETEANYHSHYTRRDKLDGLALPGAVDSKTEQSVTKRHAAQWQGKTGESNDKQIDWIFVLAMNSHH